VKVKRVDFQLLVSAGRAVTHWLAYRLQAKSIWWGIMKCSIVKAPDNRLFQVSRPFDWILDMAVLRDLVDSFDTAVARGLSAPQIGHNVRAFIFKPDGKNPVIMVNPVILRESGIFSTLDEGCLSYPGLPSVAICRPMSGSVQWEESPSQTVSRSFRGWDFRCILHEIDHLNGITIDTYRKA
jgi:peptide deformylase